jgi:hypothetical protein
MPQDIKENWQSTPNSPSKHIYKKLNNFLAQSHSTHYLSTTFLSNKLLKRRHLQLGTFKKVK